MNKKKSGDIYKIICIILLIILIGIVAVWGYRIIVENRANSKYEEIQNTVNSAAKQAETEAVKKCRTLLTSQRKIWTGPAFMQKIKTYTHGYIYREPRWIIQYYRVHQMTPTT